jgi:hypothetical protein
MAAKPTSVSTPSISVYNGSAARLRRTVPRLRAASTPVSRCGYRNSAIAEPSASVM